MNLSVIITHYNDLERLKATVQSLKENSTTNPQIIIVDDASSPNYIPMMADFQSCEILWYDVNVGVAASRIRGVNCAETEAICFTDSHMRFNYGWDKRMLKYLEIAGDDCLLCSTYDSDKPFDKDWFDGDIIRGAVPYWFDGDHEKFDIMGLRPVFTPVTISGMCVVPSVIGACYLMHTEWFSTISQSGFNKLCGYGCDEQLLAWQSWLNGGQVRACDEHVIHLSGKRTSSIDHIQYLHNKLMTMASIMDVDTFNEFTSTLAEKRIGYMNPSLYLNHCQKQPTRFKIDSICERLKIQTISEAICQMEQSNPS